MKKTTQKTESIVKTKNNATKEKRQVKKGKTEVKVSKKVVYLSENVTGAMLTRNKIDTNNSSKKEIRTISWCIRQALKHDSNFFSSFSNFSEKDIIPANLLPLKKEHEAKNGNFSVWLVLTLVSRYYATKK